jgi:hypothetical protein
MWATARINSACDERRRITLWTSQWEAECELKHCVDEEGRGLRSRVTGRRKVGVKGDATLPGPLLSIISCPPHGQEQGGLLQTSDGSILGRDNDESKAASSGRRRNGKDEVGVQWSRFQRLRTAITWFPVLRAASRVCGRASENRCSGHAILPPIPQLLR